MKEHTWYVVYVRKYFSKKYPKLRFAVDALTFEEAKKIVAGHVVEHFAQRKDYQFESVTRSDTAKFFPCGFSPPNEPTFKVCPRCGEEVLNRTRICRKCQYCFPMNCEGCGREIVGQVWCPECGNYGVYHFQRTESLPLIQPEEKSVEKFVRNMLIGRKDEENLS